MRTFGELLTEYMQRTGISDSEMARTLGVSRQTIFRWKEGLVARPRSREDVLRCAQRLRLAPQERDDLLISAGFAPEARVPTEDGGRRTGARAPTEDGGQRTEARPQVGDHPAANEVEAKVVAPGKIEEKQVSEGDSRPVTLSVTPPVAVSGTPVADSDQPAVVSNAQGADSGQPPEVAENASMDDRQTLEARNQDSATAGRPSPTNVAQSRGIVRRPSTIRRPPSAVVLAVVAVVLVVIAAAVLAFRDRLPASQTGNYPVAAPGETLIVLAEFTAVNPGEPAYDVTGRVQAALEREIQASRLGQVRVVQLAEEIKDPNGATAMRERTGATIVIWGTQTNGQVAAQLDFGASLASAPSPLGTLVTLPGESQFSLDSAVPEELRDLGLWTVARLYLAQQNVEKAQAVLAEVISRPPAGHDSAALINLDLGYLSQIATPPELDPALKFYSQAIDLAPDMTAAYLDRGVLYLRQDQAQLWQDDFMRTLTLQPAEVDVQRALCWGYALATHPELALPHCNEAVAHDSTALSRDARGVVYAELGRGSDAIADFQAFVEWLNKQPQPLRDRYLPTRTAWIQVLKASKNPIDQAVLTQLRGQ